MSDYYTNEMVRELGRGIAASVLKTGLAEHLLSTRVVSYMMEGMKHTILCAFAALLLAALAKPTAVKEE